MKNIKTVLIIVLALFLISPLVLSDNWFKLNENFQNVYAAGNIKEKSTSKLGHIRNRNVKIYSNIYNKSSYKIAGEIYTNRVYYIKKQATTNGKTYYLISTQPSSINGVVGWVEAKDLSVKDHKTIDKKNKTLTIKGTGSSYAKAWGGKKDIVYADMSQFANQQFHVDLTETVGKDVWYRGTLNGKRVWLHSSQVLEINKTSKLGHLRSQSMIYRIIGDTSTAIKDTTDYKNRVYYIKQQAQQNGETYYLISTQPSNTAGIVGWVKADHLDVRDHKTVDKKQKSFFIRGTGSAYAKAWGGKKDLIISDLSKYKDEPFEVHLTETVGNNVWYRGYLDGKRVWIHESNLRPGNIFYTEYNLTLDEAVEIQMRADSPPQTDKYRNEPAYVSEKDINFIKKTIINGNGVRLRTSPKLNTNNNIKYSVNYGTEVKIIKEVQGDSYQGSNIWYQIEYNRETLYVHSKLVTNSEVPVTTANLNVRSEPNTTSHIYGVLSKGTPVNIIEKLDGWYKITFNTWRNAKRSDVRYYLDPENFINDEKQRFQFLDLRKPSGATAAQLNKYLNGKGVLEGQGQAFIDAAKKHGINELYLISHALLETGNGTKATFKYNGVTVYNVYGIAAYDSDAYNSAAKRAYQEGWTSVYKAIVGGAEFIGNKFIKAGQNTLYKMRWNPDAMVNSNKATHQYATDVAWASKQINRFYEMYKEIGISEPIFDIPVYNK